MKLNNVQRLGLSFALCLSFAVNACGSDDDNPKPDDSDVVTGGSSGAGGAGGSGGSGGNTSTSGGAGGTDAGGAGGSGSGGTSTTNGVGGSAGAPTTDSGGAGGSGGTATITGGGSGGTGLPECDDPTEEECFDLEACSPTEEVHVLNQCSESDCFAYDNEANLPLYNGGDLPPVP